MVSRGRLEPQTLTIALPFRPYGMYFDLVTARIIDRVRHLAFLFLFSKLRCEHVIFERQRLSRLWLLKRTLKPRNKISTMYNFISKVQ